MSLVHFLLALGVFLLALPVAVAVGEWAAWVALVSAVAAVVLSFTGNDRQLG